MADHPGDLPARRGRALRPERRFCPLLTTGQVRSLRSDAKIHGIFASHGEPSRGLYVADLDLRVSQSCLLVAVVSWQVPSLSCSFHDRLTASQSLMSTARESVSQHETAGSLLPVAPSTRLVHAPTSVGRSTTPAKWLPAETGAGRFMLTYAKADPWRQLKIDPLWVG